MGLDKEYKGYQSFEYLDAGADYEEFNLPDEMNVGGEPYEVPLTDAQENHAHNISATTTIVSTHEHPTKFVPEDPTEVFEYTREGRTVTAYEYLARSNLDAAFDFHLDGSTRVHSKSGWKFSEVVHDLGIRASDIAHQDFVIRALELEDIHRAHEEGKVALIPAMESAQMIENELDRLDVLQGLGVRLIGIAYSNSNALGTGLGDMRPHDGGLTNLGYEAVERMNDLGMMISVSHSSDQTALDVAGASEDPVVLTHDGGRALNGIDRCKPDKCLEAVAETGGVIGVQSAPHGTFTYNTPAHSIESVMEHFEYLVNLVGIDHVAFGTDTLYGDHREFHKMFGSTVPDDAEEVEYVKGMENTTEAWHNIVRWLVREGYDDDNIQKVLGENILRVVEEVWP